MLIKMLCICQNHTHKQWELQITFQLRGVRWLSGRVSDSGARGRGSIPTAAVLCPWARHFTPRKYWLITQEAVAPSRHDWKIVDWDVKPQHNQPTFQLRSTGTYSRVPSDWEVPHLQATQPRGDSTCATRFLSPRYMHQLNAAQSSAENMWRKAMSRQHVLCTDDCALWYLSRSDENGEH